jgi:phage/plasmid primase-like uncharacterized protein
MRAVEEFRHTIEQAGLTAPETIVPDGELHRFASNGDRADDAGWYVLHDDGIPAGIFGCFRSNFIQKWCAKSERKLTEQERAEHRKRIEAMQRQRDGEERQRHTDAAQRVQQLWNAAPPAPSDHPYLLKKQVRAYGLRVDCGNRLIVPVTINGALSSLQFINGTGAKLFQPGGAVKGGSYTIGDVTEPTTVLICEGFATGASLYEAAGLPVVVAFSAGNLLPVAQAIRLQFPTAMLVIGGDHDLSGTGQRAAREAADAVDGVVALPEEPGQDFNDVHVQRGREAVQEAIETAIRREEMRAMNTAAAPADTHTDSWPQLDEAALHGPCGDVVKLLEPHTEADRVALLVSFLSEAGTMLNRGPHLFLDGVFHPLLFWAVLVGTSSKSRKGTAGKRVQTLMSLADPTWTRGEAKGTLSSGEGLAFAVRDPQYKEEPVKKGGQPTGETVTICADSGVEDKRLFLVQSEFGAVLRVMGREGNSLSGVLRDAWDGLTLAPMTKANRVRATDPHIGIVAHVTKDELLRNLTDTEASNGFGNRYGWFMVRRSKELPFPSSPSHDALESLATRIGKALHGARSFGTIGLTNLAREAWAAVYHDLSADRPGMAGALLARGETHVMRLSALYACLDGHASIDLVHLKAGLSLWQYAEESTRLIFGDSLGNPIADTILRALRASGELTDSHVSDLFSRHLSATMLEQAKTVLLTAGLAHCVSIETGGRPRIVWRAGAK